MEVAKYNLDQIDNIVDTEPDLWCRQTREGHIQSTYMFGFSVRQMFIPNSVTQHAGLDTSLHSWEEINNGVHSIAGVEPIRNWSSTGIRGYSLSEKEVHIEPPVLAWMFSVHHVKVNRHTYQAYVFFLDQAVNRQSRYQHSLTSEVGSKTDNFIHAHRKLLWPTR